MGQENRRPTQRPNNGSDPHVVLTRDLARALREWRKLWEIHHPIQNDRGWEQHEARAGRDDSEETTTFTQPERLMMPETGPVQYLAEQTGLNPRSVSRVFIEETKVTSLHVADKLLQATGMTYKLHNNEIEILRNPRMSQERWAEIVSEWRCY